MARKLTSNGPALTTGGIVLGGAGGGGGSKGLPRTMQVTAYHVGDDGDIEPGITQNFTAFTTGQFAGTTAIDTPHYAANGISFAAPSTINDAGAGLVTFLDTDTIRVRGSTLNDGVYTIAAGGGGAAGSIVVNQVTIVNEIAGPYVTICKRSSPSNNCVQDNITGLMWKRNTTGSTGNVERVGHLSTGVLNWYDTAMCFTLHPAAADLQMMVTGIKIVGGAAELPRYFSGMIIDPSGFANAVNNLPGYRITAVAVNGADLDISLYTGRNTLIAEAAAGARDIRVICRSVFAYAGAANAASFGGFSNWRIPNPIEALSICDQEVPNGIPNAVAFPGWPSNFVWTSQTNPGIVANGMNVNYVNGTVGQVVKTTNTHFCAIVR